MSIIRMAVTKVIVGNQAKHLCANCWHAANEAAGEQLAAFTIPKGRISCDNCTNRNLLAMMAEAKTKGASK